MLKAFFANLVGVLMALTGLGFLMIPRTRDWTVVALAILCFAGTIVFFRLGREMLFRTR